METLSYILLLTSHKFTVLILPMRNGNRLKMQKLEKKILKVLILPMRNGNSEIVANTTDDVSVFLSYL